MKITVKEIGISGAIIIGSGLVIGAISALCQKESSSLKKASKESNPKSPPTPVVQMGVVSKSTPEKKPMTVTDTVVANTVTKEILPQEQMVSTIEIPEIEEIETEIAQIIPLDTPEESTPKPVMMNDDFPLQLGSKGARVFALQKYLLKYHGYGGAVTDEFDQNLADRVKTLLKVEQVDQKLFKKLMRKGKRRR